VDGVRQFPTVTAQTLDPDPLLAELLNREPVSRVQLPFGEPCWLVTHYEDVRAVLNDPRFSRAATIDRDVARTQAILPIADSILGMDGPDHTRIRRLVSATFTAACCGAPRSHPRSRGRTARRHGTDRPTG
jgi:cytochrome P450